MCWFFLKNQFIALATGLFFKEKQRKKIFSDEYLLFGNKSNK